MQYRVSFYQHHKPYVHDGFNNEDAASSLAFWIERAMLAFNYYQKKAEPNTGLNEAVMSLMSDLNKSKAL